MKRFIAFDLEGPLTPTDAAYELLALAPNGRKIFEKLSLYDDYLTLNQRSGYEPGFALSLATPFLAYHKISSSDFGKIATNAPLIGGSKDTILRVKREGFEVFVVTTAPQEFAWVVAKQLGIEEERVFATRFPVDEFESYFPLGVLEKASQLESEILKRTHNFEKIAESFEEFYWNYLLEQGIDILNIVEVIGSIRKREIVEKLAHRYSSEFSRWAAVGDSITDRSMLAKINEEGGLAIVFNGNSYALEKGNVAVASLDLGAILPVCKTWQDGGLSEVRKRILEQETGGFGRKEIKEIAACQETYFWLPGKFEKQVREIAEIHSDFRKSVRGEAGKLG